MKRKTTSEQANTRVEDEVIDERRSVDGSGNVVANLIFGRRRAGLRIIPAYEKGRKYEEGRDWVSSRSNSNELNGGERAKA